MKIIPFRYKVDLSRYSASSQKSVGHELMSHFPGNYEDISYTCIACNKVDTFTAFEQKKAYENRKDYIDCKRVLCGNCWKNKRILGKRCKAFEANYAKRKREAIKDKLFLSEWLMVLTEYKKYSYRYNYMRIQFIKKHLEALT